MLRGCLALLFLVSPCWGWTLKSSTRLNASDSPVAHFEKVVESDREVSLHLVLFDTARCSVEVIDHPAVDGDLSTAMRDHGCLAGVNGNYFQQDRTSLGLVISNGRTLHPFQRARLLSGLLVSTASRVFLLRAEEYRPNPHTTQALQAGPFLIDHGKAVTGLDNSRRAVRTVVLWDGKELCGLLVSGPMTLAQLADILRTPVVISEMKIVRALNLDGGGSTGLWVAGSPKPYYLPEISSVRNYLGIIAR